MENKRAINISTGIVFRTILILLGLWFLYFIRDIIALIFIAILIVSAMDPIVTWMQKKRVKRSIGVILVYVFILLILSFSVSFIVPPLVQQFFDFAEKLPAYFTQLENTFQGINSFFVTQHIAFDTQTLLQQLGQSLASGAGNVFSTTIGIFSGLGAVVIILVMAFYMTIKENGIKNFIISLVPQGHKDYAALITDRIKNKMGKWMLSQLFLMVIIFILNFIALSILDVPYALAIAIFGGLMEIVPYVGPIVSAVPAVFVGLLVSPLTGLLVFAAYILIQQLEGHIIIPQIMSRVIGLHPIAVILALLIGFKLGGVLGAILAIPVATAISVFVADFFEKSREG